MDNLPTLQRRKGGLDYLWACPVSQLSGERAKRGTAYLGPFYFATLCSLTPTLAIGVSFLKKYRETNMCYKQICAIIQENGLEIPPVGLSLTLEDDG